MGDVLFPSTCPVGEVHYETKSDGASSVPQRTLIISTIDWLVHCVKSGPSFMTSAAVSRTAASTAARCGSVNPSKPDNA